MIAGRYRLDREIGRGGMGAVWLATDTVLGREVALKQLAPVEAGGATSARAEREARLAARLSHRNVVTVFDLVQEADRPWLVMEYVAGTTLTGLVADRGPLTPEDAAEVLLSVVDALRAAHRAGVIHRDVKPSNILVAPDGRVKLTDFGIARGVGGDTTLTQTGLVTGSPSYLSPEVASGASATTASDVWSLGATLFFAVTGQAPYDASDNVLGTMYRIVHEEPPRTTHAGRLTALLTGTMTRDPEQRWSLDRVHSFLTTRVEATQTLPAEPTAPPPAAIETAAEAPVIAPEPPRRQGRKDRPRRKGAHTVLAGLLVLLVLLVAGGAFLLGHDSGEETGQPQAATSSATTPASPSTTDPGEPSSAATTEDPGPTAEGVQSFVETYLTTAASDPDTAFTMLTPEFQTESGGLEGYRSWWGPVESIDQIEWIEPELGEDLGASYRYTFTREGASHTENVHLSLTYDAGTYLIAGD